MFLNKEDILIHLTAAEIGTVLKLLDPTLLSSLSKDEACELVSSRKKLNNTLDMLNASDYECEECLQACAVDCIDVGTEHPMWADRSACCNAELKVRKK